MQNILKMQQLYHEMELQRRDIHKRMSSFRKSVAEAVAIRLESIYKDWKPKIKEEIVILYIDYKAYSHGYIAEVLDDGAIIVYSERSRFSYSFDLNLERLRKTSSFDLILPSNIVVPLSFFETVKEDFKSYTEVWE